MERMLDKKEVQKITSLSRSALDALEKKNEFPSHRKISERRVAWLQSEVFEWIESRPVVKGDDIE